MLPFRETGMPHQTRSYARKCLLVSCMALAPLLGAYAVSEHRVLGDFSSLEPAGGIVAPWRSTELPSIEPARFSIEDADGTAVLRVDAAAAASSLARDVDWDVSALPFLNWRWRINRVVSAGDISTKSGDDFAARLYVMFDYPLENLPMLERTRLRVARWIYGDDVPAAALCYVWGNREAVDTSAWSAYTDRVRVIVMRNRDDAVGAWVQERRNVLADYRHAFGDVPPRPLGIAIAADTDQTGESVTTWFGDITASR
jgi:hypothetical protein